MSSNGNVGDPNEQRVPVTTTDAGIPADRDHLVSNMIGSFQGVEPFIQERAINLWRKVDPDLGARLAQGVGLSSTQVGLAAD